MRIQLVSGGGFVETGNCSKKLLSQFHTKQEVAADTIQHALFPCRSFFSFT